jgi:hypothetical protein
MKVVRIVIGVSLLFAVIAHVVLLMHLKTCNAFLRMGFALCAGALVFTFSAIRFALHLCELKLISWIDVKVAKAASWEQELNRKLRVLRTTLVTEPPFVPAYLWFAWRFIASLVLPDYLLAEQQSKLQNEEERFVVKLLQSVIHGQFRAARLYSGLVFGFVALMFALFRFFVLGRLMRC